MIQMLKSKVFQSRDPIQSYLERPRRNQIKERVDYDALFVLDDEVEAKEQQEFQMDLHLKTIETAHMFGVTDRILILIGGSVIIMSLYPQLMSIARDHIDSTCATIGIATIGTAVVGSLSLERPCYLRVLLLFMVIYSPCRALLWTTAPYNGDTLFLLIHFISMCSGYQYCEWFIINASILGVWFMALLVESYTVSTYGVFVAFSSREPREFVASYQSELFAFSNCDEHNMVQYIAIRISCLLELVCLMSLSMASFLWLKSESAVYPYMIGLSSNKVRELLSPKWQHLESYIPFLTVRHFSQEVINNLDHSALSLDLFRSIYHHNDHPQDGFVETTLKGGPSSSFSYRKRKSDDLSMFSPEVVKWISNHIKPPPVNFLGIFEDQNLRRLHTKWLRRLYLPTIWVVFNPFVFFIYLALLVDLLRMVLLCKSWEHIYTTYYEAVDSDEFSVNDLSGNIRKIANLNQILRVNHFYMRWNIANMVIACIVMFSTMVNINKSRKHWIASLMTTWFWISIFVSSCCHCIIQYLHEDNATMPEITISYTHDRTSMPLAIVLSQIVINLMDLGSAKLCFIVVVIKTLIVAQIKTTFYIETNVSLTSTILYLILWLASIRFVSVHRRLTFSATVGNLSLVGEQIYQGLVSTLNINKTHATETRSDPPTEAPD